MSEILQVLTKAPGGPWTVPTIPHTLEALQGLVGGCIEPVDLPMRDDDTWTLWCNEEGKIDELPWNDGATMILMRAWHGQWNDPMAGPVFVTRGPDDDGNTLGLSDADVLQFSERFGVAVISTERLAG